MTIVIWIVLGLVFAAAMVSFVVRARREIRSERPAPLESGSPREAIRAVVERNER